MADGTGLTHLRRCVRLAAEAPAAGDQPFGSVLVGADGSVLDEDRNRVGGDDHTQHPGFALARWAAAHLTPEERRTATVYTSSNAAPGQGTGSGSGAFFRDCRQVGRIDNGQGVENEEQGAAVLVCAGTTERWSRLWPRLRHFY